MMEGNVLPDDKFKIVLDMADKLKVFLLARKGIAVRFLYTVMYAVIFMILRFVIELSALAQFAILFVTTKPHESLRKFSNKMNTYTYKVMRYMTLTENTRPYPFSDLPAEIEPMEEEVKF
ncbi:MAG: DUF4389 domain-containing protein [Desulfobacteraceae bacterium]|nr:DUF4389 domain-containing protein [Desulfobacteraceae bacterium]